MQVSHRVRFAASAVSVLPSVRPGGITGGSHASKAFGGQVGGSTGRGGDVGQVVVAHPLKISRAHNSSEVWIFTDDPFDGLNLGGSAPLRRGDARGRVGLDSEHPVGSVGKFLKRIGSIKRGLQHRLGLLLLHVLTAHVVGFPVRPGQAGKDHRGDAGADVWAGNRRSEAPYHGTIPTSVPRPSIVMIRFAAFVGARVLTCTHPPLGERVNSAISCPMPK